MEKTECGCEESGKGRGVERWWEERSVAQKALVVIGFVILGVGLAFLFGLVVMKLWNWLMPEIFGLKRITYWQGWGLLLLCAILFKGSGPSGPGQGKSDRRRKRELRRIMREEAERDEAPGRGGGEAP